MTSLEVSKELWERGLRYETYWYWIYDSMRKSYELMPISQPYGKDRPAYLLHELLEIMPDTIEHNGIPYTLTMSGKFARYEHIDFDKCDIYELVARTSERLADAVAKCLIYLIDNGYCKVVDGEVVV